MGIQELPQTTVRALGASQVLTDPASLVKELIDNALDARATSIAIEISSNTLDVIQLRDNGHGIARDDRALVARRYCTSKITDDTDLATIGGSSLGFRGEALASVAELSGSLTITTRVEGEAVASSLKINQQGEVIGEEDTSAPVGTTVRITDFIKANPVRRQLALKNAVLSLKRILQTLQAYAFARPHVRLSLRERAKDGKHNWVYAPKPEGTIKDVAIKTVGAAACASQYQWSVLADNQFTLEAFLPTPGAENISTLGPFLMVDRRPISAARGIGRAVVRAFKEATTASSLRDAFFYLNIKCPLGSYDPNVEPAKDDMLFHDFDAVVALVRQMFEIYALPPPVLQATSEPNIQENVLETAPRMENFLPTPLPSSPVRAKPRNVLTPNFSQTTVSPSKEKEKVWFDHLEELDRRPLKRKQGPLSNGLVSQGEPRPVMPRQQRAAHRDFMSASELLSADRLTGQSNLSSWVRTDERVRLPRTLEHSSAPEKAFGSPKHQQRRPLGELSDNAPISSSEDVAEPPVGVNRQKSSEKLRRRRSSRLPLERTPAGQGMHNVVLRYGISEPHLAQTLDEEASLLTYTNPTACPESEGIAAAAQDARSLAVSLKELIASACHEDVALDLVLQALQQAFTQHALDAESDNSTLAESDMLSIL